ncbi:MAG: hypothetical protein CR982_10135 [Candidatus Cloacimonadota bacterium]|nr:MAG: hypothetical protein CR982_10135 [Candidatus Cloacimonadota bacterium]PIE77882.1 MAG: hypothetical protein CSA15_10700 [Candidatus Delongbacteria bacterium]
MEKDINWIRDEISNVEAVPHGSTHLPNIVDFSSSVIKLDLPIDKIISNIDIYSYPDTTNFEFRSKAAENYNLSPNNIFCGNGSSEIMWSIGLAFVKRSSKSLLISPTFGEYKRILTIMGSDIEYHTLKEDRGFRLDISTYLDQAKGKDIIFICNPNNPTGEFIGFDKLETIFKNSPNTLYIIDSAYIDFAIDDFSYREKMKYFIDRYNVIFLHSLTKSFGIAGLRSGYCLASEEKISLLDRVKTPWNINRYAQEVSIYILENEKEIIKKAQEIKNSSIKLRKKISNLGFTTIDSTTDYFLVKVGNSLEVKRKLLEEKILIRELQSMGLNNYIRVTGKDEEKNNLLLRLLKRSDFR